MSDESVLYKENPFIQGQSIKHLDQLKDEDINIGKWENNDKLPEIQ